LAVAIEEADLHHHLAPRRIQLANKVRIVEVIGHIAPTPLSRLTGGRRPSSMDRNRSSLVADLE
jgi:hypothetical protein